MFTPLSHHVRICHLKRLHVKTSVDVKNRDVSQSHSKNLKLMGKPEKAHKFEPKQPKMD